MSDDDIQIVKVVEKRGKRKEMTWVSSSFDDLGPATSVLKKTSNTIKQSVSSRSDQYVKNISQGSQQSIISAFTNESLSRKRPRQAVQQQNSQTEMRRKSSLKTAVGTELWSEKYRPSTRFDLAVHKKKVEEVADWLKLKSSGNLKRSAPILLLTGPPGAGKSVCLQLLCAELGLSIQEWTNNSEQAADQWSNKEFNSSERSSVDTYMSQSQSSLFHNFLLRANKYRALHFYGPAASKQSSSICTTSDTVILVEDLPNLFFRDSAPFHNILRKYHSCGKSPLVFIMSESNSNSVSIQKLFPKDLQLQLDITNISFNPVAPTMLTKVLTKVTSKELGESMFSSPRVTVIETIAMSSNGDIRSALNTLQFACRQDTKDLSTFSQISSNSKNKQKSSGSRLKYKNSRIQDIEGVAPSDSSVIGAKDKSVFLFHSVGKILYFKRGEPNEQLTQISLPNHLKSHERDPLKVDPEDVASQSHVSGEYFTTFLHENYVEFLSSMEDLERAAQYFSDSDYVSTLWMAREELQKYSVSIATRGFIHSNSDFSRHDSVRKSQGWRPLHKSQLFDVSKKAIENITSARQLFKGYHWEPEVLCTEILPYISLCNPTLHDTGQINFVQEMTHFSRSKNAFRPTLERLDEKDVVFEDDTQEDDGGEESHTFPSPLQHAQANSIDDVDNENISSSQTNVSVTGDEDEVVIEDFDDDI